MREGILIDELLHRPDGDEIAGLETEHFFDLLMRVGHPVLGVNLIGDVVDGRLMPTGDCLDRVLPVFLGQALEIEDLPFEDPPDVGVLETSVIGETLDDVLHRIVDDVLERLIRRPSLRLLPHQHGHDN